MAKLDLLYAQLIKQEDLRLKPYRDTKGKLTIGVGRNLDDVGITKPEAMMLLANDVAIAEKELLVFCPFYASLDDVRQNILLNMCFNMGIVHLLAFKDMIAAINDHDYVKASQAMLDSEWAKEVGGRAVYLADAMEKGFFAP